MFTSSALRNMDPSLEEAAEISGASAFTTLFSVTFPLIMPAIVSGMLLSFIVMLGIYGIPAVLGAPTNLAVLTTYIFKLTNWSPPLYNTAAAVAIILMVVTGALVFLQQRVLSGRSYTTVAGKAFRPRSLDLGRWRWFTFALGIAYLLIVVVLPTLALIVAAFRKFMFIRDVSSLFDMRQYSLVHFHSIFDNPLTMRSIYNAVEVGVITAVVGGALAFAIGYTIHRTQVTGRRWIDLISTVPVAIPGLVVGVAYLWAWIGIPAGLYGTIWILALAFIARFMPDTVKALSTSFLQIHRELEEAAWVCGKGMLGTVRTIVLPLARPGVIASMTLLFVLAIRELGSSLFLYTSNTMVMSVLLLDYYEGGNLGKTAAFSLVQTVLLGVLIGGANWLSRGAAQGSVRDDLRVILKQTGMTALYVTHDQAEAVVLGDRIGVMRDGKLLQMDTPDAIYNRPADLFVANFTGATNELAGTLVSRNGDYGLVDFGEGRRGEVALLHSLLPDEKVRIALRPENITIGQHNGANIFPARVLDRRYQGTQTAYGIELFGKRLEVLELGTAARHQVGVETPVSLPRESCWAYRDTGPASYE
jgi:iron(III) transport system permease protein